MHVPPGLDCCPLHVRHDRRRARVHRMNKPEAFKDCEVLVTMLPQGKIVREVLLGKANIASGLQPGTIVVDTSSSSPFDTQKLGEELAQHQIQLLDSPITQTYMYATDRGESTLMVGSDSKEAYQKAEPILKCMVSSFREGI